jgi:hypothetical protein
MKVLRNLLEGLAPGIVAAIFTSDRELHVSLLLALSIMLCMFFAWNTGYNDATRKKK